MMSSTKVAFIIYYMIIREKSTRIPTNVRNLNLLNITLLAKHMYIRSFEHNRLYFKRIINNFRAQALAICHY